MAIVYRSGEREKVRQLVKEYRELFARFLLLGKSVMNEHSGK